MLVPRLVLGLTLAPARGLLQLSFFHRRASHTFTRSARGKPPVVIVVRVAWCVSASLYIVRWPVAWLNDK
jgi:hypothetical protein